MHTSMQPVLFGEVCQRDHACQSVLLVQCDCGVLCMQIPRYLYSNYFL